MRPIYADAAAYQPLLPSVRKLVTRLLQEPFANPSALHEAGLFWRQKIELARAQVADLISAPPSTIIFTSGTTEGTATVMQTFKGRGPIVVSAADHPATLNNAYATGNEVRLVPVNNSGQWLPAAVIQASRGAALVSLALVSNETGVRQKVEDLTRKLETKTHLHLDLAQAVLLEELSVDRLGAEYLTFSGSKLGGLGGGVLYVGGGAQYQPLIEGGGQEGGRRSGTENFLSIIALGAAAASAHKHRASRHHHLVKAQAKIEHFLRSKGATILGGDALRAPHIIAAHLPGIEAEEVVIRASALGLALSAGSACSSKKLEHPLYEAMGFPPSEIIRLSLPWSTNYWSTRRLVARLSRVLHTLT
jgi:cysteine desulfurase